MRRKDREITDFNEMLKIIDECDVCRIALSDGEYPYIVPLNFGYTVEDEDLNFYIHGAQEGRKIDLMKKNKVCSFEMDCAHRIDMDVEKKYATMRFKSVMGKADIEFIEGEAKKKYLDLLVDNYPKPENFEYAQSSIPRTAVVRLHVTELTGKANKPKE